MGLKSDWMLLGRLTLGTGTVLDSFHILGWTPCLIAALAMDAKGSARMWEKSWNIQADNPSGPPALESLLSKASTVMVYSLGTSHCQVLGMFQTNPLSR